MLIRNKESLPSLTVALLIVALGVIAILVLAAPRFQTSSAPTVLTVSDASKKVEISLPDGWKKLEVKNKVFLNVPQDMKPSRLIGDSFAYREAYSNKTLEITIVYGEVLPRLKASDRPFDPCETPRSLLEQPTYQESLIDINGRKAKLGINRRYEPEYILADVCFVNVPEEQLIVSAHCKDATALQTANEIFKSIKFVN